jgi:hypothetical protein
MQKQDIPELICDGCGKAYTPSSYLYLKNKHRKRKDGLPKKKFCTFDCMQANRDKFVYKHSKEQKAIEARIKFYGQDYY